MRPTWPLLALTLLQGLSVGLMSIAAILLFTQPHDPKMIFILQGTAFITGGIGGLSSIFHMHRLQGAKYVLRRLKTSWLSREALSTGLYMMVVALTVLVHLVALPLSGLWKTLSVIAAVFWRRGRLYHGNALCDDPGDAQLALSTDGADVLWRSGLKWNLVGMGHQWNAS